MKAKKKDSQNVQVTKESSLRSRQSGDRTVEKFKSDSTSTYDDGSTMSIKQRQKTTTNKKGKTKIKDRSVAKATDSQGNLLFKQVDKGGKTRVRVTRAGRKPL